jgi:RNA polymerase sigma-70 factor (ECF subfamily)
MAMRLRLVTTVREGDPGRKMDERELVRAARRGDEEAFAALVRRYSSGLHRTVARMLGDDTEAWDVVQMAFLKAWQRLDRYDSRWSVSTWLYRIATNLAIDLMRARTSRERAELAGGEHHLRLVGDGELASKAVDEGELERIMGRLLTRLTPQQRAAFVLREIEGLPSTEVAEAIGCTPTTVRNHVFQARKVLRRELELHYPEYLPSAPGE